MNLDNHLKTYWVNQMIDIYSEDESLRQRLSYYLPLIGFRWCLILLNEFRSELLSNRIHADHLKKERVEELKTLQLQKSEDLFLSVLSLQTEDLLNEGYSIG
jgi:hypothetical protein